MVADFHSHILPGIDDGSASVEQSLQMLRREQQQGITRVVATPHFYAQQDNPRRFIARRQKSYERLMEALRGEDLPQITLGAEVYYFRGISEWEELELLAFQGSRYIMVEMPMAKWTEGMYRELAAIRDKRGLVPVVAHVDRYISPLRTHKIPEKLADLPVLVQANAHFFTGKLTRGMALRMLKNDAIHLLGSDCHDLTERPPCLGEAVEIIRKNLGGRALEPIVQTQNMILR